MNKTIKKNKKDKRIQSRRKKNYRKTHNTRHKLRKSTGHHKYHKHHKHHKSHKHMKGGEALYYNNPSKESNDTKVSYDIGNNKSASNTYVKNTDRPSGPVSTVSITPNPISSALWSVQSMFKNLANEIMGQPKMNTSSPTQQPIGKTINPYIPNPISNKNLTAFKTSVLNTFK